MRLEGGAGDDRLAGHAGGDRLRGGLGDDVLAGGAGADLLDGGGGRDTVIAGSGDDTLVGHGDRDHLVGGSGRDTLVYEHELADYRVELVEGDLRVARGATGAGDRIEGIEHLQFGERSIAVETLKEYLTILEHGDEEERQRRIGGMSVSSGTTVGDAAAIGLVAAFSAPAIAAEQRRAEYAERPATTAEAARGVDVPVSSASAADAAVPGPTPAMPGGAHGAASSVNGGGGGGGNGGSGPMGTSAALPPEESDPIGPLLDTQVVGMPALPGEDGPPAETVEATGSRAVASAATGERAAAELELPATEADNRLNYLFGSPGDDLLVDDLGLDVVYAFRGDDRVDALQGDDRVYAAGGDDVVFAGAGRDVVFGGAGADLLAGGSGADRLFGQDGDDVLRGGAGADVMLGGSGDDVLHGGAGVDTYVGGTGDDALVVDAADDLGLLDGGRGYDTVALAAGYPGEPDLTEIDTGSPGGDGGIEAVRGSSGDDRMHGSYALERIAGGPGHDVVTFGETIREVADQQPGTGELAGLEWLEGGSVLRVTGPAGDAVELAVEVAELDGHAIHLDGRDNAPITSPDRFHAEEDTALVLDDADLTGNDFDVDPGETVPDS
ncbi:MAG: calcium-binding protein [Halofilum sp. (in: g-proteobacteria)]|nr:calcium-binding protein [Halofilum sp. (in: g-proteobacteria)]